MALLLEREAAERLRVSWRTVRALRLSGRLRYLPGRPVRIDEQDLEAYIDRLRDPAEEPKPAPSPALTGPAAAEAAARLRAKMRLLAKRR